MLAGNGFSVRESLHDIGNELRQSLRGLSRARAFMLVAVVSLALGIGINSTLFTLIHTAFLKPVPGIGGADRVVEVLISNRDGVASEWAYPDFEDVRDAGTPIALLAGWKRRDGSLSVGAGSERVRLMYVSASYFRALGVVPSRGRDFLPAEDAAPGSGTVAIVSHAMWQTRLGGDEGIVGRTLVINRVAYTVIGVAPETFRGSQKYSGVDLWLPLAQYPAMADQGGFSQDRNARWVEVLGRLRAGATLDQADAAVRTVFARLARAHPETNEHRGGQVAAFGPFPAVGRAEQMMAMGGLVALSGLVLLVICANVAGMTLARSATREREVAVRIALGAGRGRLVRQWMMDALVLAVAGGGLGILTAYWATGTAAFERFMDSPGISFRPNASVLLVSLALALGTTLIFGLFPALKFSRPELVSLLKDDSGGGGRRVGRTHRIAASAQTGLAMLFLVVCGLFLRAQDAMSKKDLGFQPANLFVTELDLSTEGYGSLRDGRAFLDRVKEAVAALPGVTSVSFANGYPLDQSGNFTGVSRADRAEDERGSVTVEFTTATDDFFQAVGTPLLRGRGFARTDDSASDRVVVITQLLAERLWPGEEALGRQISFALDRGPSRPATVVGVVGHVASSRATEDWPQVFMPLLQNYERPRLFLLARATAPLSALSTGIRSAVLAVDPSFAAPTVLTSDSRVLESTQVQRASALMAGALGLLALLLSAIGVYGVVAFAVSRRTREIGIRMAIGATQGQVLGSVLRDGVRLAAPGLVVGALLAAALAAGMRSMLLGVAPLDAASFFAAAGLLILVVLLASLVPARWASAVQPMEALRSE
jgi:predicted permease